MTPSRASHAPTELIYNKRGATLLVRGTRVRVAGGPDAGISCELTLHRVRVGSAPDNDLALTDSAVSRHHLEFQVHDRGYVVADLGSTNGTYYRGARVREALLGPGAELRLGNTVLRLEPLEERSKEVGARPTFGNLVGGSPAMQEIYGLLEAVSPSEVTVLITGETGTGKELVAETIHRHSPRSAGPFGIVDCASMPPTLIESELFGHRRGAFTGATADRAGVFERSRGGVVFLDEIGELPLELQSRLLRVLEQRTIQRLGDDLPRRVDVRIVAATNRALREEIRAGHFRQDLYYRLAVITVKLPPLRDRLEDIPLLARHFLWDAGCADPERVLTPEVLEVLRSRKWPGNVRELRNVIERATLLSDRPEDAFDTNPQLVRQAAAAPSVPQPEHAEHDRAPAAEADRWDESWLSRAFPPGFLDQPYKAAKSLLVDQFEALYLKRLLDRHGRNISRIAHDAGVDRHAIRKLMRKHSIE